MTQEPITINLVLLLEDWLNEVRVIRTKRVPARIRLKRKRYYRKRKARLRRLSRIRRRKPRSKRLAKRRAAIRKRMHIRPGSRRRIRIASADRLGNLMEGRQVNQLKDLIRGFENVSKLVDQLEGVLGKEKLSESLKPQVQKKLVIDDFFPDELPSFNFKNDEILNEDFESILGIKKPVKEQKAVDYSQIKADAASMVESLKTKKMDEQEALQILTFMTESLDKAVEKVILESKPLTEEDDDEHMWSIFTDKDVSHEVIDIIEKDLLAVASDVGEYEVSANDGPGINLHGIDSPSGFKHVESAIKHAVGLLKSTGYEVTEIPQFPNLVSEEKSESTEPVQTEAKEEIDDNEVMEYLEQWRDSESFRDFNLMMDRGLLVMACDLMAGSGAIDPSQQPKGSHEAKMEQGILDLAKEYKDKLKQDEDAEFFKNMEVWIDKKTNEHAFIPQVDVDYFVGQNDLKQMGYEFDSGYDDSGNEYKDASKLDESKTVQEDGQIDIAVATGELAAEARRKKTSIPSLLDTPDWKHYQPHKEEIMKEYDRQQKELRGEAVETELPVDEASLRGESPMVIQYLVTAMWASTDDNDQPLDDKYDPSSISEESLEKARKDCDEFYQKATTALEKSGKDISTLDLEDLGHDFWLTRNGHGANFKDGDYEKDVGEILFDVAKEFGESHAYVGDDGQVFIEATVNPQPVKGKDMTPEKKAEMGKSLAGKFVRSGDTDSAKKIMKHGHEERLAEAKKKSKKPSSSKMSKEEIANKMGELSKKTGLTHDGGDDNRLFKDSNINVFANDMSEKEYQDMEKDLSKKSIKGKGYEVYAWNDSSSYKYWKEAGENGEANYIQVTATVDLNKIDQVDAAKLKSDVDELDAYFAKYDNIERHDFQKTHGESVTEDSKESYSDSDLQGMSAPALLDLIRSGKVTYSQVDAALEKIKKFSALDWIGDQLHKDELKPQTEETELDEANKEISKLDPAHKKAVMMAIGEIKKAGYPKIADAVKAGKWTLQKAGDWAEDKNFHGLAAIFRQPEADHAVISHGEKRHNEIDLETGEQYPGERDAALAVKYDAANGSGSAEGRKWDEEKFATETWGRDIKNRKLRSLVFLDHHGMQDSKTFKEILKHIEAHKADYQKHLNDVLDNIQQSMDSKEGNEKFTPEEIADMNKYQQGYMDKIKETAAKYGLMASQESVQKTGDLTEAKSELIAHVKQIEADLHKAMHEQGVQTPNGNDVPFKIYDHSEEKTQKEKGGKVFHYPEMLGFNVESWDTMKFDMTGDGKIIREGTPVNGPGISKDDLINQVIQNVKEWNDHVGSLKKERQTKKEAKQAGVEKESVQKPDTRSEPQVQESEVDKLKKDPAFMGKRYPNAKKKLSPADTGKLDALYKQRDAMGVKNGSPEYSKLQSQIDAILGEDKAGFDIEKVIKGIQGSYGDKYSDQDYSEFREFAKKAKSNKELISLVSNLFDLDHADARDMVESKTESKSGPEETLFTPGDITSFGSEDSIILSKMIVANLKHLGIALKSPEAKQYQDLVYQLFDDNTKASAEEKLWAIGDKREESMLGMGEPVPGEQRSTDLIQAGLKKKRKEAESVGQGYPSAGQQRSGTNQEGGIQVGEEAETGDTHYTVWFKGNTPSGRGNVMVKADSEDKAVELGNAKINRKHPGHAWRYWKIEKMAQESGMGSSGPNPGEERGMMGSVIPQNVNADTLPGGDSGEQMKMAKMIASDVKRRREKYKPSMKKEESLSVEVNGKKFGLTEASDEAEGNAPQVYVGTYAKYNNGDLTGKWMNLEDYKDKEAFLKAAHELHKDEADPELMFQDYQGFPERFYNESSVPDELWDWIDMSEDDKEMFEAYAEATGDTDVSLKDAQENFMGRGKNEEDIVAEFLEDTGGLKDMDQDSLSNYLIMSETDIRVNAGDDADSAVEGMDENEILEKAEMSDEYEAEQDESKKKKILDQARDEVISQVYEETKSQLEKDPVGFFEALGYTPADLVEKNIMSFDYEAYARDMGINDVDFVTKDGETWGFWKH